MTSKKYPETTWETSLTHEALRLIYYLKRLPELELQHRGFFILPQVPPQHASHTIIIPDLPYSQISRLWSRCHRLDPTTPMSAPSDLVTDVAQLLQPHYQLPHTQLQKIRNLWQTVEKPFFHQLSLLLPQYYPLLHKINFIITHCGSPSQFNILTTSQHCLTIYCRSDSTIPLLALAIVLALIRHPLQYHHHHTWEEIESIADFLLTSTSLTSSLLPFTHTPLVTQLRSPQLGPLHRRSQNYQARLGIPSQNLWRQTPTQIFYGPHSITNLSQRQNRLLHLLIDHRPTPVTIDQIATVLWPDNEHFSLWAIAQEITRIRRRLTATSLPASLIQSHRHLGYSVV